MTRTMRLVEVSWVGGYRTFMRDPKEVGRFLRGVECDEHGIAVRQGCSGALELMVRLDRIDYMSEVAPEPKPW